MKWLNALAEEDAIRRLLACCGSSSWARRVANARPFTSAEALLRAADEVWQSLGRQDYLEAFSAHPRIGDVEALRTRFSGDRWAGGEQAGAAGASDRVLQELAEANRRYEDRFGYIFIVCATGKTADEMLAILNGRLLNDAGVELPVAAEEQRKITRLRIAKMLDNPVTSTPPT